MIHPCAETNRNRFSSRGVESQVSQAPAGSASLLVIWGLGPFVEDSKRQPSIVWMCRDCT